MSAIIKVAIVDDAREDAQRLEDYLKQYQEEHSIEIQSDVFYASFDFLEKYKGQYDVIFLDIEMPGSNGIDVAKEIRSRDETVGIIFVTSMAQYALSGYEVNAIDFMVKPMGYYNFSTKLEKAFKFYETRHVQDILLSNKDGIRRIPTTDILYIEKDKDTLIFHTKIEEIKERGSVKQLKEKLVGIPFAECTAGCLVNLGVVKHIGKDSVTILDGTKLPLSRRQKKEFTQEYIRYIGIEG